MRLSPLRAVVYAADRGLERIRADGYYVNTGEFRATLAHLAALADLGQLPSGDTPRKFEDDGPMTAIDVAAIAGVTPHAVRLAAREGRLPGESGPWRFNRADVDVWLAERKR